MIRILLVDDQDLIRRGMKALLKSDPELEIVGEAHQGDVAVTQVEALAPDVVLMDVRMPVMDGVAATRIICERFPQTRVLVLTTFDDQVYVRQALTAGAAGYLLKDTPFDELTQAIRFVHKGYTQLGPGIAPQMMMAEPVAEPSPALTSDHLPEVADLTPREREILQLIAQGANNREIAQQLFLSEKTVRNHVSHLLSRLGLRDRTQAAIYMHKNGSADGKL